MTRSGAAGSPLLVALVLSLAPAAAGAGDAASRIAVLGASQGGAVPASAVAAIAQAAISAVRQGGADAVPPGEVARAAAGADLATCGASAACAVTVCAAVGADALLVAKLKDTGTFWYVEMRLRDGRRGSVRGQAGATVAREVAAAEAAATRLANQVLLSLRPSDGLPPPMAAGPAARSSAPGAVATPPAPPPLPYPGPERQAATGASRRPSLAGKPEGWVAPEPPLPRPVSTARSRWGVTMVAGGAALLAGGAVTGGLAWSQSNTAYASLARGDLGGFALGSQSSRSLAWTAAGLGAAGTAALAAGAWLWLGDRPTRVSLELEPGFAGARFALAF